MSKTGDVFYINLPLLTAADYLVKGVKSQGMSNELVSEYNDLTDGNELYVLVFEKYYMRSSNRTSLTVCLHQCGDRVKVFAVGSGGGQGAIFGFDWGAADSFGRMPREILNSYIV